MEFCCVEFLSRFYGKKQRDIRVFTYMNGKVDTKLLQQLATSTLHLGESLEDEERRRPPSLLNDHQLNDIVEADPRQTVNGPAQQFGVDGSTISRHSNAIGKVKKLDKWIPYELTARQMLERHDTCVSIKLRSLRERF
ncbi:unnamed protein product [Heligmosomoides polygyrus]|uniref:HTH psq-type domain-containing protein n=1 Tax=Heligmosomoides polygyrus TaxID=6339 RepID=A0A183GBG3_HELPZ|nr:unnamed protein product [Heligmosomoides polygyrus]